MKLVVSVISIAVASSVFANDTVWEIASPDLPGREVLHLAQEGNETAAPTVDAAVRADQETQSRQQNSRKFSPPVKQSDPDPVNKPPPVGAKEVRVQREANTIQQEANAIVRKANDIQRHIRFLTLLLFVVGLVVGALQILLISRQSKLITSSECLWVIVNPLEPYRREDTPNDCYEFKWTTRSIGGSPAFLTRMEAQVKVVPFPILNEVPMSEDPAVFGEFVIPAGRSHDSEMGGRMEKSDFIDFTNGKRALAFYGTVNYRSAFGDLHHTRFYTYWIRNEGVVGDFPVGPPKTVEYT